MTEPIDTDEYTETSKEFERRIVDGIQRRLDQIKGKSKLRPREVESVWVLTD